MIDLSRFHDQHTRQLPLIAARAVLDALAQPNTAEGLKQAAEHTNRAAGLVAELCGRLGRSDWRRVLVDDSKTARAERDGVPIGGSLLLRILARTSAVIRDCDPNHLPDDAVRAAGASWPEAVDAVLNGPVGIPPRAAEGAVAAYAKELRYLAGKLRDGQRYKRDDDAWIVTEFRRGSTQEIVAGAPADELWRPQGVFGAWRGHEVGVTRETLTAAGFDKLQEAFATAGLPREASGGKHSGAWAYVAAPERAVMPFFKPQQGSTRWFTASADRWCVPHQQYQDVFIPAVADFLERLANVIEAREIIP